MESDYRVKLRHPFWSCGSNGNQASTEVILGHLELDRSLRGLPADTNPEEADR